MLKQVIDSALILESTAATAKGDLLDEVVSAIVESGRLPPGQADLVRDALRKREALGSTGIGNGVAVPHVKHAKLDSVVLTLARSEQGVDYAAVDGRAVHLLFLILAPEASAEVHLQLLRWISKLARHSDFRRFAGQATGTDELRELLHELSEA